MFFIQLGLWLSKPRYKKNQFLKIFLHLLPVIFSSRRCSFGKIFASSRVDDGATGVDDKANVLVHGFLRDGFEAATLGADAGDEIEMIGGKASDPGELLG